VFPESASRLYLKNISSARFNPTPIQSARRRCAGCAWGAPRLVSAVTKAAKQTRSTWLPAANQKITRFVPLVTALETEPSATDNNNRHTNQKSTRNEKVHHLCIFAASTAAAVPLCCGRHKLYVTCHPRLLEFEMRERALAATCRNTKSFRLARSLKTRASLRLASAPSQQRAPALCKRGNRITRPPLYAAWPTRPDRMEG